LEKGEIQNARSDHEKYIELIGVRWFNRFESDGTIRARATSALLASLGASAEPVSLFKSRRVLKKQHRKQSKKPSAAGGGNLSHDFKSAGSFKRYSKANLDLLTADLEKGIRDLPVWREWVQRFGLAEARKFLRRGLVINQLTDGNAGN
jgi:hypothetical protein